MSSDPRRNNLLSRILAARYRLETAEPEAKADARDALNAVFDEALQDHPGISRCDLVAAIAERMRAYRADRRRAEPFSTP